MARKKLTQPGTTDLLGPIYVLNPIKIPCGTNQLRSPAGVAFSALVSREIPPMGTHSLNVPMADTAVFLDENHRGMPFGWHPRKRPISPKRIANEQRDFSILRGCGFREIDRRFAALGGTKTHV